MRAAVMRETRLVVDTIVEPEPGNGAVSIPSLSCGICGSDLHALKHGAELVQSLCELDTPNPLERSRDVVMGRELCAEVPTGLPPRTCARSCPIRFSELSRFRPGPPGTPGH